jgi:hypothetical protein
LYEWTGEPLVYLSSNFNAVFDEMIIFMSYWWTITNFLLFYFKKGSKRDQLSKILHIWKVYRIVIFNSFLVLFFSLFELIRPRASMLTDFVYLLWSTEGGFLPLNFLILHQILMQFFLQNDYWWTIKNFIFYFKKGSEKGPKSEISHIWKAYWTLQIIKPGVI